jgi:hypothetical protein
MENRKIRFQLQVQKGVQRSVSQLIIKKYCFPRREITFHSDIKRNQLIAFMLRLVPTDRGMFIE